YVRTVMINAGAEEGLARGQAAITGEGLVGRLTEVGSRAARILLITDLNSRIPVTVDGSHSNAVLCEPSTVTGMRELRSVSSRIRAARLPTSVSRPTRPSPVIAA